MNAGLIGGIAGGALGVIGGAIGTYFSIRSTLGPRERTFMVRVSAVIWVAVGVFLCGLLLLPRPYNFLLWIPYGLALPLGIRWCNQRQLRIRAEEAAAQASGTRPS